MNSSLENKGNINSAQARAEIEDLLNEKDNMNKNPTVSDFSLQNHNVEIIDERKKNSQSQPEKNNPKIIDTSFEVVKDIPKLEKKIENIEKKIGTDTEGQEKFLEERKNVLTYLDVLIKLGRGLRSLKFDIADDTTREEIIEKIKNQETLGVLEKHDVEKILDILGTNMIEDKVIEVVKLEQPEIISNVIIPNELDDNYVYALNVFGPNTFSLDEYLKALKVESITKSGGINYFGFDKIFDKLVEDGRFKKVDGSKYVVVDDGKTASLFMGEEKPKVVEAELIQKPEIKKTESLDEPVVIEVKPEQEPETQTQKKEPEIKVEDETVLPDAETLALEKIVDVDGDLSKAREDYSKLLVEFKNSTREKKGKFAKILSDLGIEKQMPEAGKSQELLDAEKIYIQAKKKKAQNLDLFNKAQEYQRTGSDGKAIETFQFNPKLVEQAEKEYEVLQRTILDSMPTKEKGIFKKGLEKWQKLPISVRVLALPILIGTALALAPTGGLAIGATYAGMRTARALGGIVGAKYTGKVADWAFNKENEFQHGAAKGSYGKEISNDNYEQKEKELMNSFDKEENRKKRQRLYKASAMVVGGGLAGLAAGGLEASAQNAFTVHGGFGATLDNLPKFGKPHIVDSGVKPKIFTPETPKVQDTLSEVKLSSKGYIQTIEDLKKQLAHQYEGKQMPTEAKDFIAKPSAKLAQDYGFYDAKHGASGMGLKGENLAIDSKGNLKLEHLNGKAEIINSTDHKFSGKMFNPEEHTPKVTVSNGGQAEIDVSEQFGPKFRMPEERGSIIPPEIPQNGSVNLAGMVTPENLKVPGTGHTFSLSSKGATFNVDVIGGNGTKQILVDGIKVAESTPNINGTPGVLHLLDKYQDGNKYSSVREAFVKAQDIALKDTPLPGKTILPAVPFENGQISVVRGIVEKGVENPNAVKIFLNGKEIAKGLITEKGPHIKVPGNLKGGIFLADTVYERAFKHAKPLIKTLKFTK